MPNKERLTLFGFCFLVQRSCNPQYTLGTSRSGLVVSEYRWPLTQVSLYPYLHSSSPHSPHVSRRHSGGGVSACLLGTTSQWLVSSVSVSPGYSPQPPVRGAARPGVTLHLWTWGGECAYIVGCLDLYRMIT